MVQITTVSMNGSCSATSPSVIGSFVRTAEGGRRAEPMPASLEKAARRKPWISAPTAPPATPSGLNAPTKIAVTAAGICVKLARMMITPAPTYITPMNGTTFSVTRAIDLMPPMITTPTITATTSPNSQPLSAMKPASPPVMLTICWNDWLAWNMLPPPSEPAMQQIAKNTARTLPNPAMPFSARPLLRKYIGPPETVPSAYSLRYLTPSVHSANFNDMPIRPAMIIQNVAPGPPIDTAIATPAMLPSPTVPESAVASA